MTKSSPSETAAPAHPRDISAADLETAMAAQSNPDLLGELVEISRAAFGFYPKYFPYTITYPWASERLSRLPAGSRVLDMGAGVSPVPLYLATKGIKVECVDNSKHMRTLPPTGMWNEWGFLDYGALHPNLKSHHCDITRFEPPAAFDAIYAIAVLAHMPRTVRENTLLRCRDWLKPSGFLLLIVDVIPSSDFIWNRAEGVEIEPPIQHGTIDDFANELQQLAFRIDEWEIMRTVYQSRTDLLLVVCNLIT